MRIDVLFMFLHDSLDRYLKSVFSINQIDPIPFHSNRAVRGGLLDFLHRAGTVTEKSGFRGPTRGQSLTEETWSVPRSHSGGIMGPSNKESCLALSLNGWDGRPPGTIRMGGRTGKQFQQINHG